MKKDGEVKKPPKPLTLIQKVCLQRGQDERTISNSYCLIKFLKENEFFQLAYQVEHAVRIAKQISKDNYTNNRIKLDPTWLSRKLQELNKDG